GGGERHVGRLDVPVYHGSAVEVDDAPGDVRAEAQRPAHGERAVLQQVGQVALVGVGHHEVGAAVGQLVDVVDVDHMTRLRAPQQPRLAFESLTDVEPLGPVLGEHLNSDVIFETVVVGKPHRRDSTGAQQSPYGISTDRSGLGHGPIMAHDQRATGGASCPEVSGNRKDRRMTWIIWRAWPRAGTGRRWTNCWAKSAPQCCAVAVPCCCTGPTPRKPARTYC